MWEASPTPNERMLIALSASETPPTNVFNQALQLLFYESRAAMQQLFLGQSGGP